jgi:hypothetical protein
MVEFGEKPGKKPGQEAVKKSILKFAANSVLKKSLLDAV